MLEQNWSDCITEYGTHNVQILLWNIVLDMKHTKLFEPGVKIILIVYIGHHLMNDIHDQSGMILKEVMERVFVIRLNLKTFSRSVDEEIHMKDSIPCHIASVLSGNVLSQRGEVQTSQQYIEVQLFEAGSEL